MICFWRAPSPRAWPRSSEAPSSHTGAETVELDCSVPRTRSGRRPATGRATPCGKLGARVRRLRPERVSDTQQLVHLRNALKKACDEDLGNEWRSACASSIRRGRFY